MQNLATAHPREIRAQIREGKWRRPTGGLAAGYAQANLAVLPRDLAYDFLLFCQRNPKPCPVLEVLDVGSPHPVRMAAGADLRSDVPLYRVYRSGELEAEVTDLHDHWREDLVAFLLGCSFSFEAALASAGIPLRHIEEERTISVYITSIQCVPAGMFAGPLVVSMRPIPLDRVAKAVEVTARYPMVHGAPVHIGDPAALGIVDIARPDYGEAVTIREGEVPVFWACGVTPQAVARQARPELMLTHAPAHMFVTDLRNDEL